MDTPPRKPIRRIKPLGAPANMPSSTPAGMPTPPARISCPACHKLNPATEIYCYSCGALLVQTGQTRQIEEPQDTSQKIDPSFFGDTMVLHFYVRDNASPLLIRPRQYEMVIGRTSKDSPMTPDIDLAPYNGEALGVSRLHAGLRRHEDTLVMTDLGSVNYTHINGQRLHPHEIRVVNDGDTIRFGQLTVRVSFRKELKPLDPSATSPKKP